MKIKGIALALLIGLAACQPDVITPEFTDAEAVYLNLEKTYILHSDGSFEKQVIKSQKLLTHRAFHSLYGQTDIYYNPETDSVVVEQAETQTPDGKTVQVPENGYVDMIPSFARGSSHFSHLRHKAVVHTALERGAVINSSYTIYSKPGSKPALMGHEILSNDCPVMNFKLVVKVPKDQSVNYKNINLNSTPKIKKKGKYKVYTWEESNIDQNSPEPFGVRFNGNKKQIVFSSADSLFPIFNEFTSQKAFTFETNIGMRNRVNESLKGKTDTFEKIGALQKIVSEEIQTIPVPLSLTEYKIRPAVQTWESMAGTKEEKAVLLCALIRSTGWKATPVATVPEYIFNEDSSINLIGNLDLLSFDLIQFPVAGADYYLGTDHVQLQSISSKYPNHYFIPLEMGYSKVNLKNLPVEEFQLSWDGELKLIKNAVLKGEFDANFMGPANPYMAIKMNPDAINGIYSGKGIIERAHPKSTVLSFETEISDAVIVFGNKIQIDLPYYHEGFNSWGIKHLSTNRDSDFVLPHPIREFQRLSIIVPANFKPIDLMIDFSLKNEVGRISIRHSYESGKITSMRSLLIQKTLIQADEYDKLKELLDPWLNPDYQRVIMEISD
ncbi:MAG: DUF3857 domain-containing protein [Bacteroidales bacterium]|nr:DUF3857 domain-containing protein [Bacteroidales bacterium]